MVIARMWESRLSPEAVDDFPEMLRTVAWPDLTAVPGFLGGEVYRSGGDDDDHRMVVVTRWADGVAAAIGAGLEHGWAAYCAREPHAWEFEQLDVSATAGHGRG